MDLNLVVLSLSSAALLVLVILFYIHDFHSPFIVLRGNSNRVPPKPDSISILVKMTADDHSINFLPTTGSELSRVS